MISELKLKCYSCKYERLIGELELITDLQECPQCDSDNIEIVATEASYTGPPIDPLERARIVRRRMWVIGSVGFLLLLVGVINTFLIPLIPGTYGFLFGHTFMVVGFLCLVVASGGKLCCPNLYEC